jgi:uncharacterized protein YbjT (DUF2867 family)
LIGMILVTGASGTIGSEVFRRLTAAGGRPRAFVRDPLKARALFGDAVEHIVGDLDRPETVDAGMEGVDRVFLLTRQSSRQLAQERHVIEAAVRAGVRHVVKLSVFRADERSPLRIARQHRQIECVLEQSGLPHTIVRPVFFMQNLFAMVRQGAIRTAAGGGRVAMVDARDVAAVAVDAIIGRNGDGRIYTLTGPQSLTFGEVAATITQQTGEPVRHEDIVPGAVRDTVESSGAEPWFARDMSRLHVMLAAGYEDVVTDDVRRITGTTPGTLAEFARDHAHAFANGRS